MEILFVASRATEYTFKWPLAYFHSYLFWVSCQHCSTSQPCCFTGSKQFSEIPGKHMGSCSEEKGLESRLSATWISSPFQRPITILTKYTGGLAKIWQQFRKYHLYQSQFRRHTVSEKKATETKLLHQTGEICEICTIRKQYKTAQSTKSKRRKDICYWPVFMKHFIFLKNRHKNHGNSYTLWFQVQDPKTEINLIMPFYIVKFTKLGSNHKRSSMLKRGRGC